MSKPSKAAKATAYSIHGALISFEEYERHLRAYWQGESKGVSGEIAYEEFLRQQQLCLWGKVKMDYLTKGGLTHILPSAPELQPSFPTWLANTHRHLGRPEDQSATCACGTTYNGNPNRKSDLGMKCNDCEEYWICFACGGVWSVEDVKSFDEHFACRRSRCYNRGHDHEQYPCAGVGLFYDGNCAEGCEHNFKDKKKYTPGHKKESVEKSPTAESRAVVATAIPPEAPAHVSSLARNNHPFKSGYEVLSEKDLIANPHWRPTSNTNQSVDVTTQLERLNFAAHPEPVAHTKITRAELNATSFAADPTAGDIVKRKEPHTYKAIEGVVDAGRGVGRHPSTKSTSKQPLDVVSVPVNTQKLRHKAPATVPPPEISNKELEELEKDGWDIIGTDTRRGVTGAEVPKDVKAQGGSWKNWCKDKLGILGWRTD